MPSSIEDIKDEEEDIFQELGNYDFQNKPFFSIATKEKARKQLDVSEDSPFNTAYQMQLDDDERRKLKEQRASLLSEETKEIRRQLDLVKKRLNEIKHPKSTTSNINCEAIGKELPSNLHNRSQLSKNMPEITATNEVNLITNRQKSPPPAPSRRRLLNAPNYTSSTLNLLKQQNEVTHTNPADRNKKQHLEAKYRPLTGKADCPNCNCDRRSSVCDQCIGIALVKPMSEMSHTMSYKQTTNEQQPTFKPRRVTYQDDERPIRPAKERTLARVEADEIVVPNRIFTISKSLNDKRTKLAQAIDDLQLMMDQVKERSNKLEKERKVVQLYKDQWKYGPSIGGPSASSREQLGSGARQRNYESRLDANLRRDSNSLMGYKSIEPVMKLRQYKPIPNTRLKSRQLQQKTSVVNVHSRSKSFESLKSIPPRVKQGEVQTAMANFQSGKPSSELNLASSFPKDEEKIQNDDDDVSMLEAVTVGSPTDSVIIVNEEENQNASAKTDKPENNYQHQDEKQNESNKPSGHTEVEKIQKMTWIPVFGETEIKTVTKRTPKRKLQIVKPTQNGSRAQQASNAINNRSQKNHIQHTSRQQHLPINQLAIKQKPRSNAQTPTPNGQSRLVQNGVRREVHSEKNPNDRLMNEARRRLKFAGDLLEQEKVDSSSKNQLIIRKPIPKPRLKNAQPSNEQENFSTIPKTTNILDQTSDNQATNDDNITPLQDQQLSIAINEIARLEEMVNEQQRVLARLSAETSTVTDHRHLLVASPITVSCSSPCCHHHAGTTSNSNQCSSPKIQHSSTPKSMNSRTLVNSLRDRLNKTKTRLAKTLEEEREKHQQLKLKVDSSLRKQSDLENENELLKQALSKCIDTCLKDISNTFETLSDTLSESMINNQTQKQQNVNSASAEEDERSMDSGRLVLTNAAQLISDNKHLKQMKNHIDSIENQRKSIFDELSREKQRSNQLELQLKESQNELNEILTAKQKLESQLEMVSKEQHHLMDSCLSDTDKAQAGSSDKIVDTFGQHSASSKLSTFNHIFSSQSQEDIDKSTTPDDLTYNSVEVYRRYIQSMSPDIEALRKERKSILSEFDNIKKILTDMDN